MRILFLAPQPLYVPRGTPMAVRDAVTALADLGHSVDVLSFHEGADLNHPGVRHLRCARPPGVNQVPIGPSWQKACCDICFAFKALRLLHRGRYDMVHAVEEAALMARWFRPMFGVPYIDDVDSLMSEQIRDKSRWLAPVASVFAALERGAIRHAAGVLAVCPALVTEARRHRPKDESDERVALLPDTPVTGVSEQASLPTDLTEAPHPRIVYVGNLVSYQGIDLLLAGFRRVADEMPNATLVVVGGSQRDVAHYRGEAGDLAERGRVRFVGALPPEWLGAVLGEADVLVSPRTQGRNTPMKIYNYLQSGKPVLATRLQTHTQVLNDEVAQLVEPSDEGLAYGLRELLTSRERRERLGAAGRALVEAEYSKDAFRKRLADFYERIAPGQSESSPTPVRASGQ